MASTAAGMGALPVLLDVGVAALDVLLGYWIFKYGRVLLAPPSQKLNGEVGVFSGLRNSEMFPINSLSDPINALSQPLKTFSSLLFGWNSPFGVIRLHETFQHVCDQCYQSFIDDLPMPKYNTGSFVLEPKPIFFNDYTSVRGWLVSRTDPATSGSEILSFSKQYLLGTDAGGSIVFN